MKTWLKRPRNLYVFAPRIPYDQAAATIPNAEVAANFGQAVLLTDAHFAVHRDGTVSSSFRLITMLHGDRNLADWDDRIRSYDTRTSLHTFRKSYVHLPDGSRRKAKRTHAVISPKVYENRLSFHPLRPGVVIDFEEQTDQFRPFAAGPSAWDHMFFHGPAIDHVPPCARLRYTVAVAQPFAVQFQLHHCDWEPKEWMRDSYRVLQWDLTNLDGHGVDEYSPNPRDYLPWVDISTLPDWSPIGNNYRRELVPTRQSRPAQLTQLTREITANATSDRGRLTAIYEYATRHVRYGRRPFELTDQAPREVASMLEDLRGDCKDKTALMHAMLSEVGIDAKVVLVLTRWNGTTPFLPGARFDHAILKCDFGGETVWVDPADGSCTCGELPFNDQGVQALVLDGDMTETTVISPPKPEQHVIRRTVCGAIDPDGRFHAEAEIEFTGDHAASVRRQMKDCSAEHMQRLLGQLVAGDLPGADVTGQRFVAIDDFTQPVRVHYHVQLRRWVRRIQELLLFRIPWVEEIRMTGPMNAAERNQPMHPNQCWRKEERHEITIPHEFVPYGLPYSQTESCSWGSYSRTIRHQDNKLICERRMELHDGIVSGEQFQQYKAFWESCAHADAAEVLLWFRPSGILSTHPKTGPTDAPARTSDA